MGLRNLAGRIEGPRLRYVRGRHPSRVVLDEVMELNAEQLAPWQRKVLAQWYALPEDSFGFRPAEGKSGRLRAWLAQDGTER
jgi:hypothetical protein